eukprot:IDg20916t1
MLLKCPDGQAAGLYTNPSILRNITSIPLQAYVTKLGIRLT